MKLKLNKKKIKNLSKDNKTLPADMTPQIAGGFSAYGCGPISDPNYSCPNSINTYSC